MVTGVGVVVGVGELVVVALDDFPSEFARRYDCVAGCTEEQESCGAFWTVFGKWVCTGVGARELFTVAIARVLGIKQRIHETLV